jgi:hypothetical protein
VVKLICGDEKEVFGQPERNEALWVAQHSLVECPLYRSGLPCDALAPLNYAILRDRIDL